MLLEGVEGVLSDGDTFEGDVRITDVAFLASDARFCQRTFDSLH